MTPCLSCCTFLALRRPIRRRYAPLWLGGGIRISRNFVHRHEMRNFAKFRAPLHMVKCEYLGIHMVNIISRNFVRRHEMRNFAKFRAPLYGNPPPRWRAVTRFFEGKRPTTINRAFWQKKGSYFNSQSKMLHIL